MEVTAQNLITIAPLVFDKVAAEHVPFINAALDRFQISDPYEVAGLLAVAMFESGALRYMEELASGQDYEPGTKAGLVLGNTHPGDGPRYKGRGPIQITGRKNYTLAGNALGYDLENFPGKAAQPECGWLCSAWYWKEHDIGPRAVARDFLAVSRLVNLGTAATEKLPLHWEQRQGYWRRALRAFSLHG